MKSLSKLEPADLTETHICTIVIYNVCHDLQLNIPTVENGEPGFHRSLQNGTDITENKCCLACLTD